MQQLCIKGLICDQLQTSWASNSIVPNHHFHHELVLRDTHKASNPQQTFQPFLCNKPKPVLPSSPFTRGHPINQHAVLARALLLQVTGSQEPRGSSPPLSPTSSFEQLYTFHPPQTD